MAPAQAVDELVSTLNGIISRNALPVSNIPYKASIDAAKFLLMKVLLNKGAFIDRAAPTFADADMQQVVTLGTQLITSGRYSLNPVYFNNFGPNQCYNKHRSNLGMAEHRKCYQSRYQFDGDQCPLVYDAALQFI